MRCARSSPPFQDLSAASKSIPTVATGGNQVGRRGRCGDEGRTPDGRRGGGESMRTLAIKGQRPTRLISSLAINFDEGVG